ncbi:MAG TPA: VOC family protein [Ktedonobacterales bacterium]|nr:VOC family protein [Ktedonobacterales bacterium]
MEFNRLIPELGVADFATSLAFYTEILGFQVDYQRPEQLFAFLSYQGSQVMLEQVNTVWKTGALTYPFGRGLNLQILVDDLEELLMSLRIHRYPLLVEPEERWYRKERLLVGQRQLLVQDPDGYLLRFAQPLGTKPSEEPGTSG